MKVAYPFIAENGIYTFNLIGHEKLHDIITAASGKGWRMEVLAVKDYNPGISGIFNVLTKKQKEIL